MSLHNHQGHVLLETEHLRTFPQSSMEMPSTRRRGDARGMFPGVIHVEKSKKSECPREQKWSQDVIRDFDCISN